MESYLRAIFSNRYTGRPARLRPGRYWAPLAAAILTGLLLGRWYAGRLADTTRPAAISASSSAAVAACPPLSPPSLLSRLLLALRLVMVPRFLRNARKPATVGCYLVKDAQYIFHKLDHAPRAVPGRLGLLLTAVTSYFKHAGILGWDDLGCQVMLEGQVEDHEPVVGRDGMLTIDVRVRRLWLADGELQSWEESQQPRYIRVEIFGGIRRELQTIPRRGDAVRIRGALRLDHDGEDFFELHPTSPADIQIAKGNES